MSIIAAVHDSVSTLWRQLCRSDTRRPPGRLAWGMPCATSWSRRCGLRIDRRHALVDRLDDATYLIHTLEPDPSICNQLEQEVFAAALASGMRLFNIRPATATNKGVKFSRSTRTKLSEKAKQQFATLEARAKQSMAIRKTDEPCSLLAPGGQLHTFFNPTAFAHDHDLEPANILKLLRGTIHSYKGWTNPNTQLPPKKSSKLTNEQRDEICRRYEAGESSRTLAVVFGVMPASIIGLLKRRNIKRRPKHEAIANRWK